MNTEVISRSNLDLKPVQIRQPGLYLRLTVEKHYAFVLTGKLLNSSNIQFIEVGFTDAGRTIDDVAHFKTLYGEEVDEEFTKSYEDLYGHAHEDARSPEDSPYTCFIKINYFD